MTPARVLVSCRDAGAAAQVAAVLPALHAEPSVETTLTASPPALDLLRAAGHAPVAFTAPGGAVSLAHDADPAPLLEAASRLLDRVDPDVVLTGISSLGVGVDEALLARAGSRPTLALQDFPGDANAIGGAYAGCYLVRDEAAARLTRRRFGVTARAVGSLRHAAYAALDVPGLRASARARLGAPRGRTVLGFFGQPPEIPGHEVAFGHLVRALEARPARPLVVLREHPKALGLREGHLAALRGAGLVVFDVTDEAAAEPWLAACDLVTTCFSHCSMDYAFLSAASPEPLGAVLFLLSAPGTAAFLRDYAGLDEPDGVAQGLGRVARNPAEVGPLMDALLAPGCRRDYHEASRRLPRGADLALVVRCVREAGLGRAAAGRS